MPYQQTKVLRDVCDDCRGLGFFSLPPGKCRVCNGTGSAYPPIVVRVRASTYEAPYRLEWDWASTKWIKLDEPGAPLGVLHR